MLTAFELNSLKEPGRYPVGGKGVTGLHVQVTLGKDGTPRRSFLLRYKIAGKTREMGLGAYPAVCLAEARNKATEAAALKAKGIDPLAAKAAARAEAAVERCTFAEATKAFLDHLCAQKSDSKFPLRTVRQWRSTLARFAFPKIGQLDVHEIKHAHVAAILAPLATTKEVNKRKAKGGPSVAHRLRSRIERVLDWSAAHGFRDPDQVNPARPQLLKDVLGVAPKATHHAAPPLDAAPELYRRIRDTEGTVYRAAEFMVLTAARLREAFDAEWSEISLADKTWTISAERSKVGRAHIVPLSDAALRVIEVMSALRSSERYVFPGRFNTPIATSTVGPALAKIGVGYTRHGWRSLVRDALADRLDVDGETCEFVLGHVKGGVEGAYRRETALLKRKVAMQRLADWLAGIEAGSNVVPFAVKAAAE